MKASELIRRINDVLSDTDVSDAQVTFKSNGYCGTVNVNGMDVTIIDSNPPYVTITLTTSKN